MPTAFTFLICIVFYQSAAATRLFFLQQKIVADIERERALVSAAQELVSVMDAKIKNLIGGLWERAG